MKLVVGQGNPGNKYNFTRHNTGFLALDYYFKIHNLVWSARPKLGGIVGRLDDVFFVKPQNYYNDTGKVVANYLNFYKIPVEDLVVICDDFNLPFGVVRYRASGSSGGNNGLKSVIANLSTEGFKRIRVGTNNTELRSKLGDVDFVLSKFTPEEKEQLPEILQEIAAKIDSLI